jgi:hypothetical protein
MIGTCAASGAIGLTCANRLPLKIAIANMASALLMFKPHL